MTFPTADQSGAVSQHLQLLRAPAAAVVCVREVSYHMLIVYWQLSLKCQFTNSCYLRRRESDLEGQQRSQSEGFQTAVGTARPCCRQPERCRQPSEQRSTEEGWGSSRRGLSALRSSLKDFLPVLHLAGKSLERFLWQMGAISDPNSQLLNSFWWVAGVQPLPRSTWDSNPLSVPD